MLEKLNKLLIELTNMKIGEKKDFNILGKVIRVTKFFEGKGKS